MDNFDRVVEGPIEDPIEASRVDTHPVDPTHPLLENLHTPLHNVMKSMR